MDELKSTYGEKLPLFQRIRGEGVKRETPLLLETVKAFAQEKVRIADRQVIDEAGQPISAYCLNDEIEARLGRQ